MAEEQRRARYLEALGIEQWVRRAMPAEVSEADTPAISLGESDWITLQACVRNCQRCSLHQTRTQTVFGVGDPAAQWMVVGEAPGVDEDRQGEPFVGAAGQLLNAMLAAIYLPRESVFIANVVKCRPPGNRDPRPEEVVQCLPYLHRQISLVRPLIILAFGRVAAQNLLNTETPIGKLRGRVHRSGALNTPIIVTYHPAYLLRNPGEKRKVWEDLKFARRIFVELSAKT
ncbi:MAG: uracil-DNA glycosylase [Gammaproteobacteria bacterium]|nr:uracil-DNA glycosylase [Gammaproteobacteria bacterium]